MPNNRMTGVVWGEARTGLATECSSAEVSPLKKRKKKATSDADRKLGFGPYAKSTYGEVLSRKQNTSNS